MTSWPINSTFCTCGRKKDCERCHGRGIYVEPTVMKLLDGCCGAGGASDGYVAAGFEVIGYDIAPQPNYPYKFWQGDVIDMLKDKALIESVDGIHLSVPCQLFTAYRRRGRGVGAGYPDLIADVRWLAKLTGKPYVIENVPGAPLENPVQLCGSSFGLDVRRHRLFETSFPVMVPPCNHAAQAPGRFPGATNRASMSRATVEVGVWRIPLETQKRAMGIDREITLEELSEAIPPAFTEFIGSQLMAYLAREEIAA